MKKIIRKSLFAVLLLNLSPLSPQPPQSDESLEISFADSLTQEEVDQLVKERKREIIFIKEYFRPFVDATISEEIHSVLQTGRLVPSSEGCGGAYFLLDDQNIPRYVIKPFDEEPLCLNNRKGKGTPFRDTRHRVREDIPLYESLQRELAASAVASLLRIPHVTPWTKLAIVQSDSFYDISDVLGIGEPDKEKVCSVQPFFLETIGIGEALHEWFEAGLEQLGEPLPLDQESFENVNLFLWATYDCDGHGSNFLLYLHSLDANEKAVYGLIKIDNGLTFPTRNKYLLNYLAYLPNAKFPLSIQLREKISAIDPSAVLKILSSYGLYDTIDATSIRLSVMKVLSKRPTMTIEEMNHRMELLALPNGEQLALSTCSRQDLEELVLQKEE